MSRRVPGASGCRAMALALLASLVSAPAAADDPGGAHEAVETEGERSMAPPPPAAVEPGPYRETRAMAEIRSYRPTRGYREERAHDAMDRFASVESYAKPTPPAEERARKVWDVFPLRVLEFGQTVTSGVFYLFYYPISLVTGGSEEVTEICITHPVERNFQRQLGDL